MHRDWREMSGIIFFVCTDSKAPSHTQKQGNFHHFGPPRMPSNAIFFGRRAHTTVGGSHIILEGVPRLMKHLHINTGTFRIKLRAYIEISSKCLGLGLRPRVVIAFRNKLEKKPERTKVIARFLKYVNVRNSIINECHAPRAHGRTHARTIMIVGAACGLLCNQYTIKAIQTYIEGKMIVS